MFVLRPEVVFVLNCGIDPFPPNPTPTHEVIKIVLKLPETGGGGGGGGEGRSRAKGEGESLMRPDGSLRQHMQHIWGLFSSRL